MTTGLIYGLTHAGEIRYVGQTTLDPAYRLRCHLNTAKRADQYVCRWIRSVDYDVEMVILEQNPPDLAEAERSWIAALRLLFDCRLTNLSEGGESGSKGYKWTDEQRAARRARMQTPEILAACAEGGRKAGLSLKDRPKSPAHRAALSVALTGRKNGPPSDKTRQKLSAAAKKRGFCHKTDCQCRFCMNHRPLSARGGGARA